MIAAVLAFPAAPSPSTGNGTTKGSTVKRQSASPAEWRPAFSPDRGRTAEGATRPLNFFAPMALLPDTAPCRALGPFLASGVDGSHMRDWPRNEAKVGVRC